MKFFKVVEPDTKVVVLLFSLRILWLGRWKRLTFLNFILPEGAGVPVQSGEGAVDEVEVGEAQGGGTCEVRLTLGERRLCTDFLPKRDLTELVCFQPRQNLALGLGGLVVGGGGGVMSGLRFPYSLLPTGGPRYAAQRVFRFRTGGTERAGGSTGVGSGRCATKLGFEVDEDVELGPLGVGVRDVGKSLKVTLLGSVVDASSALPLALALATLSFSRL